MAGLQRRLALVLSLLAAPIVPSANAADLSETVLRWEQGVPDGGSAREALSDLALERERLGRQWQERDRECTTRIFVNRCLAELDADRRVLELRLRRIEISAHAAQRAERARERELRLREREERRRSPEGPAAPGGTPVPSSSPATSG